MLNNYLNEATAAVLKASAILLKYFHSSKPLTIESKGINDIVTSADMESEALIKEYLVKHCSTNIEFIGEETGGDLNNKIVWVVDPLDGTKNFTRGIDIFGISIALVENKIPKLGVICFPAKQMLFIAQKSQGAYMIVYGKHSFSGQFRNIISVSPSSENLIKNRSILPYPFQTFKIHSHYGPASLESGFLSTGFPHGSPDLVNSYAPGLSNVLRKAMALRRFGAATWDICMTAVSLFDAFWEYGLFPWDTAAGVCIAKESGCLVTDCNGKDWDITSPSVLVSCQNIYNDLIETLNGSTK